MSSSSFIVFYCVIISLDTTFCPWIERLNPKSLVCKTHRAPVAQLVEHRAAMREVVSSTPAGPTLRVFK